MRREQDDRFRKSSNENRYTYYNRLFDNNIFTITMSKEKKYSDAGKGDKSRITDKKKYAENWEKIFGSKQKKFKDKK